jgi:hypothetical protein
MMNYFKTLLLLCTILFSCKNDNTRFSKEAKKNKTTQSSPDSTNSIWASFLLKIGEPDIAKLNKEAYRFSYTGFLGHCTFMYTVVVDSDIMLYSKYIRDSASNNDSVFIKTIVKATKQKLTTKQFDSLRYLLHGTYYFALGPICPDGDGWIHDDGGHLFEFNSHYCGGDSLRFHKIDFPYLHDGSFRDVWKYIVNTSDMYNEIPEGKKQIMNE